jgi:hypothetical protein
MPVYSQVTHIVPLPSTEQLPIDECCTEYIFPLKYGLGVYVICISSFSQETVTVFFFRKFKSDFNKSLKVTSLTVQTLNPAHVLVVFVVQQGSRTQRNQIL